MQLSSIAAAAWRGTQHLRSAPRLGSRKPTMPTAAVQALASQRSRGLDLVIAPAPVRRTPGWSNGLHVFGYTPLSRVADQGATSREWQAAGVAAAQSEPAAARYPLRVPKSRAAPHSSTQRGAQLVCLQRGRW